MSIIHSKASVSKSGLFARTYEPAGQVTAVTYDSVLDEASISRWITGYVKGAIIILGVRESQDDYNAFYRVIQEILLVDAFESKPSRKVRLPRAVALLYSLIAGKHKGTYNNGNFTATFDDKTTNGFSVPNGNLTLADPTAGASGFREIGSYTVLPDAELSEAFDRVTAALAEVTGEPLVKFDSVDTTDITAHFATGARVDQSISGVSYRIFNALQENESKRVLSAIGMAAPDSSTAFYPHAFLPASMTADNVGSSMIVRGTALNEDVIPLTLDVMHYVVWWLGVMQGILDQNKDSKQAIDFSYDYPLPSFLNFQSGQISVEIDEFIMAYILFPLYNQFRVNQASVPYPEDPVRVGAGDQGRYVPAGTNNTPPLKSELVALKVPAVVGECLRRISTPLILPTSHGPVKYVPVLAGDYVAIKKTVRAQLQEWNNSVTAGDPNFDGILLRNTSQNINYSILPPETGLYRDFLMRAQEDWRRAKAYLGLVTMSAYTETNTSFATAVRVLFPEAILSIVREKLRDSSLTAKKRNRLQSLNKELETLHKAREATGSTKTVDAADTGYGIGTAFFGTPTAKTNMALDFPIPSIFVDPSFTTANYPEVVNQVKLFLRSKDIAISTRIAQPTAILFNGGASLARAPTQDLSHDEVSKQFDIAAGLGEGGMLGMPRKGLRNITPQQIDKTVRGGAKLVKDIDNQFSTPEGRAEREKRAMARRSAKTSKKVAKHEAKARAHNQK